MRPHYTPKLKKRTALLRELKEVFRRYRSQPIERVISLINPMLRGWVNYFAVGHSSECFTYIKDWVEKKVRRHMAHARKRKGFGWERWSRPWLYDTLKLFNSYRVRRDGPKVAPADRSHKPWSEANGGAQCGKPACCVRRGGGWKRGTVGIPRPTPARQSSTLPARARRCSLGWVGDAFAAPPGSNAASGVLQGPASVASVGLHGKRWSDLIRRTAGYGPVCPVGVASRDAPLSRLTRARPWTTDGTAPCPVIRGQLQAPIFATVHGWDFPGQISDSGAAV